MNYSVYGWDLYEVSIPTGPAESVGCPALILTATSGPIYFLLRGESAMLAFGWMEQQVPFGVLLDRLQEYPDEADGLGYCKMGEWIEGLREYLSAGGVRRL